MTFRARPPSRSSSREVQVTVHQVVPVSEAAAKTAEPLGFPVFVCPTVDLGYSRHPSNRGWTGRSAAW